MKKIYYIPVLIMTLLSFPSCNDWLDVNDNPDSANSTVPTAEQRLPSLIAQFADGYESAGTRVGLLCQQLSCVYAVNNNWNWTRWNSTASSVAWPWQAWYVNAGVNVDPLIAAAEEQGAFHYIGAAKVIKAMGFATLADLYGMLPYKQAFDESTYTPEFDDCEYIYSQIIPLLDEAITYLEMDQTSKLAPALSEGDILNGGNVDNWIRLAYGLKARYLNHLSKQTSYDPAAVLAALAKAPQTNAQSSILQYVDESPATTTSQASLQYVNTGTTVRLTKLYIDYLKNTYPGVPAAAQGIIDPRIDLLVPSYQKADGTYVRSEGVDMSSDLPSKGPSAYTYNVSKGTYVTSNTSRSGDTIYVQLRKLTATDGRVVSTGTWYTERGGKGLLLTNSEMKFIEAEVKFRQNDKAAALTAYKAGIRAHMEIMSVPAAAIDSYLSGPAVAQTTGDLTMSLIMIQKYIALSYSPEIFSDLRRMNFCCDASGNYNEATGVYKGFKRPSHVYTIAYPSETNWPRRFAVPSYEVNYNIDMVQAADADAAEATYISKPIWWDK
nr:SusD/RagB family nutrient-binding outer membrane lipoprotein [uncultured Macellibacteroides sp.]